MNALRSTRTGRFVRNPVTREQFEARVDRLRYTNPLCSTSAIEERVAQELRLRLICDEITGEVLDWTERGPRA